MHEEGDSDTCVFSRERYSCLFIYRLICSLAYFFFLGGGGGGGGEEGVALLPFHF